ncbi:MAG: GIY-YIG nuclease family protein [Ignavibacteriaceae bacterium]|nr:GIY-YIG nuclease family protein [Ignavibacteriaceae bacterium]
MYYSYILVSEKTSRHYYGHCEDPEKRLKAHNTGKVKFTKNYTPWKIHFFEEFATKSEAYRRELFYKSIDGYQWLKAQKII